MANSSDEELERVVDLLRSHNFQFNSESVLASLKCAKCESVLKSTCKVPCGCKYCPECLEKLNPNIHEFCPGQSDACRRALLTDSAPVESSIRMFSKLVVKCPIRSCSFETVLGNMDHHLDSCPIRSEFEYENESDDISPEKIDGAKTWKKASSGTNDDVAILRRNDEEINRNDSVDCVKLASDVISLAEKLDDETRERKVETGKIIKMNDKNTNNFKSLKKENKSMLEELRVLKSQMRSMQAAAEINTNYVWTIDENVKDTAWEGKMSPVFHGVVQHPYQYQMESWNSGSAGDSVLIYFKIHSGATETEDSVTESVENATQSEENKISLSWPFRATVAITVGDRRSPDSCYTSRRSYWLPRPPENQYSKSEDPFRFSYSRLSEEGVDLSGGLRVTCAVTLK